MKTSLICLLTLLGAILPFDAAAKIKWLSTEYNFGTFKEADGPKTGHVEFVNEGPDATFISRVRPSCGCTGASYPHTMIEPGDTAKITFTYNPAGRPGKFNKTVKIYIGEDNELTVARILGTVIGEDSTLDYVFPKVAGPLRLENTVANANEIKRGASRHLFINLYNQGQDTITPEWNEIGEQLIIAVAPASIPPGEVGTVSFHLRTPYEERNGLVEYDVKLRPDKSIPTPVNLKVRAVIIPDTDKMTVEQIDNGPRAYLLPEFVDFGEVEGGKLLDFKFEILNDGKQKMKVERVYSANELVNITAIPSKIKPGKKGTVKGCINPTGLPTGPFRIGVEVITDDPLHPLRTCHLVGFKN